MFSDDAQGAMFDWITGSPQEPWHLVDEGTRTACGTVIARSYDVRPTSELPWPVDIHGRCRALALQRTEEFIG